LKRKINSVSKNLEKAKNSLKDKEQIQGKEELYESEIKYEENKGEDSSLHTSKLPNRGDNFATKNLKKEKDRSVSAIKKLKITKNHKNEDICEKKKYSSKINTIKKDKNEEENDDYEIKMMNPDSVKIIAAKVEKVIPQQEIKISSNTSNSHMPKRKLDFEEIDREIERLKRMKNQNYFESEGYFQEEKVSIKDPDLDYNNFLMNNAQKPNRNNILIESPIKNNLDQDNIEEEDDIVFMNENIKKKFENLSDIEDSMKKLNQILEISSKSSLKMRTDYELKSYNTAPKNHINDVIASEDELSPRPKDNFFQEINVKEKQNNFLLKQSFPTPEFQKNTNQTQNSKRIEVNKKALDMSSVPMMSNYNFPQNKNNEVEDYKKLKDILMQTKKDIDELNKEFSEPEIGASQVFIKNNYKQAALFKEDEEEEELEPRRLPNFLRENKYK
jgi:hypothetical protein